MGFGPVRSATCGARTLISPTAASGLHGSKGASRQNNRYCHKNSASGLFRKSTSKHSIYPPKESPMERRFDLVVIGTGVASAVASRCREAGWTVAVVDYRPFGGTCALRGCVPKKILVSAAEAIHHARDMATIGVPAAGLTIDWPALVRFKRSLVDPTPRRTEEAWAKLGVEEFHGRARFIDGTTLAVGEDRLIGRRVLIAAGA